MYSFIFITHSHTLKMSKQYFYQYSCVILSLYKFSQNHRATQREISWHQIKRILSSDFSESYYTLSASYMDQTFLYNFSFKPGVIFLFLWRQGICQPSLSYHQLVPYSVFCLESCSLFLRRYFFQSPEISCSNLG